MDIFPQCIGELIGSYLLPYDRSYKIRNFRDVLKEINQLYMTQVHGYRHISLYISYDRLIL